MKKCKTTYKASGVDLNLGDSFVDSIKGKVKKTFSKNVLRDVGLFGSLYSLEDYRDGNYALVSSVDGVGTKLKIAFMMKKHNTVGIDLVNHCVNDIIVQGAEPLFFMDYISFTDLMSQELEEIMDGFIEACRMNNISLIGGETAQMPGFYAEGEYDLVGFILGIVKTDEIVDGTRIDCNDILIGLPSDGLHTNGYSLARNSIFNKGGYECGTYIKQIGMTVGEYLMKPHKSYLSDIKTIRKNVDVKGMAHITGGGIEGNLCRILPDNLCGVIDKDVYEIPFLFSLIQDAGNIDTEEMRRCFNMGIGMILVISENELDKLKNTYDKPFFRLGFIDQLKKKRVLYL